ncbi:MULTISPECIES: L,D-transpeptidase family protein [Sphingobacterium]|uniref:L,D-transpeptidase family protein n=1 Tax=Sphingobacterium TaxID=28453 RepID=UPI00257F4A96|nr:MULTISPECIES: L,D-transpeptidase family protein [Sphingobacterium]
MKALPYFVVIFFAILSNAIYGQNVSIGIEITRALKDNTYLSGLNYPKSVVRFYTDNYSGYSWTDRQQKRDQSEMALSLLVRANHYGLSLSDYHLESLSFEKLKQWWDFPSEQNQKERIMFDMLLTDGLISFINDLHFGKYNPLYHKSRIDTSRINGFCADEILSTARLQPDFQGAILQAQPTIKAYGDFQAYLDRSYTANDGITSQAEMDKIILNMERLRWIGTQSVNYIMVNIPSYTLEFHQGDEITEFKVVVGKPATKTPVLESEINYFSTAPDWRVPQSIFRKEMLPEILKNKSYLADHNYSIYDGSGNKVTVNASKLRQIYNNPYNYSVRQSSGQDNALGAVVFRFQNPYGVYLHDTAQKQFFNREKRALSHGCVRVENADRLAAMLLSYDGSEYKISELENAILSYEKKDFVLNQPVPIIITYLTCLIKNGKPALYADIYNFDKSLEDRFNQNK